MRKWSKNGVEKYSDCRCEKDLCYAVKKVKNPPLISPQYALSAEDYHEVGSFCDFEPFTPNFTQLVTT